MILLVGFAAFFTIVRAQDVANTDVTVANGAPTLTVDFNGNNAITLTEATYKFATASLTITDTNGCNTINYISATAWLASTSVASSTPCSVDDNNCYKVGSSTALNTSCVASSTNACSGAADTSVIYDCGFKFWYIAEATDSGAPNWASSIWSIAATASDGVATSTASNTTQTVEINALAALTVTGTLSFGTLSPGQNTGFTNSTTTATTTGNIAIDSNVKGDAGGFMVSGPNTIAIANEEFSTAPFNYGAGTDLTVGDQLIEFTTGNPTSTTTPLTFGVPWGMAIPGGQANGTYTGVNTFTAVND